MPGLLVVEEMRTTLRQPRLEVAYLPASEHLLRRQGADVLARAHSSH
jgi:hypothetical protein